MTSLMTSPAAAAKGKQEPRIRSVPEYVSSAGREAVELCALAGLNLDPWEQLALWDMLGERPDSRWACYEFAIVAPRQNGKGSIFEARELTGLFLLGEGLLIHSAHEQATSSEHFRRLLNLIEGVPEFERRVLKAPKGKGAEAIELRGGQRIFFKTRTQDGGRGLTGDFVGLDEAMKLRVATMGALAPTMAARSITGNPQLMYGASAVDGEKDEHGVVLARVRERALAGTGGRLGYHEYSCEGEDPSAVPEAFAADPENWAQANPGLGIRISVEYIADERNLLDARTFAVERLGIGDWPDTSEDAGRVISREAWARCPEHDPANRVTGTPTFSVDSNVDGTWGSVGVAGARADGLAQFALVRHERGTDWIVDFCVALRRVHRRAWFVVDKRGPAAHLIPALKDAGVRVREASTEDYAAACADFVAAVNDAGVRYPFPQPELDDALGNARKASLGDRWKWSRKDSASADISPLVAVTLALWGHCQAPAKARVVNLNDYV